MTSVLCDRCGYEVDDREYVVIEGSIYCPECASEATLNDEEFFDWFGEELGDDGSSLDL